MRVVAIVLATMLSACAAGDDAWPAFDATDTAGVPPHDAMASSDGAGVAPVDASMPDTWRAPTCDQWCILSGGGSSGASVGPKSDLK